MDKDLIIENITKTVYLLFRIPVMENIYDPRNFPENRTLNPEGIILDTEKQIFFEYLFSLEWALANREFDFKDLWDQQPYSNEEILFFLNKEYEWAVKKLKINNLDVEYEIYRQLNK